MGQLYQEGPHARPGPGRHSRLSRELLPRTQAPRSPVFSHILAFLSQSLHSQTSLSVAWGQGHLQGPLPRALVGTKAGLCTCCFGSALSTPPSALWPPRPWVHKAAGAFCLGLPQQWHHPYLGCCTCPWTLHCPRNQPFVPFSFLLILRQGSKAWLLTWSGLLLWWLLGCLAAQLPLQPGGTPAVRRLRGRWTEASPGQLQELTWLVTDHNTCLLFM